MFSKFLNRFYYGSSGREDYAEHHLPKNRFQLFSLTLKTQFSTLVMLNVVYMLFFLPSFYVLVQAIFRYVSAFSTLHEFSQTLSGESFLTAVAEFKAVEHSIMLNALLKLVPALALTGPFTVGLAQVLRNLARDEHSFVWSDAWDSLKHNGKQAFGISLISAVMPLLVYVGYTFYGRLAQTQVLFTFFQVFVVILGCFWSLASGIFYYLMVNYTLSFKNILKNGFLLTFLRLPHIAMLKMLHLLPLGITFALAYLVNFQVSAVFFALYYAFIGLVLSRFINASFANFCFETYINPRIIGAKTRIGLQNEDDEPFQHTLEDKQPLPKQVFIEKED